MKKGLFSRIFPPPAFLTVPAVALDISDRSVKFLEIAHSSNGYKVSSFGEKSIPKGIIDAGVIQEKDKLSNIFSELADKQDIKYATVSLPEEKAFIVSMFLGGVKEKQIRESISLQIEGHVPLPISEIIFDYEIAEIKNGGFEIVVTAFSKHIVNSYLEVLENAGISVVSFEVEGAALGRSLVPKEKQNTFMIVDFGSTKTSFTVISEGLARFSTTIPIGGEKIVESISHSMKIDMDKARLLKEQRGLKREGEDMSLFSAITPVVSVLRDEIIKHQNYWDSKKDDSGLHYPKISRIILCGGDSNIPGIADYLGSGSSVSFDLGNPWVNMVSLDDYVPEMSRKHSLRYATAIGLALKRTSLFS